MFNTIYIGSRCGQRIRTGFEQMEFCPGTMVPINPEKTIWKCSGCGNVVKAEKQKE